MNTVLLTQLKILKMSDIKPNFSELARLYEMDRRTIKKYYEGYEGKPKNRYKTSKLDKYKELIGIKLAIKGVNVRSVYEYLISEIDSDIGTYSNFNKYVKKEGLKPSKTPKGFPRYETSPGIQAQVDWKEDISIKNKFGKIFTFHVFSYKLGYSRYPVFIYKSSRTREDVIDCLIASFKNTGGVPKEILFDNMSSLVTFKDGHATISPKIQAFAKDFNFKIKRCKPYHPFTKGKVEAANKFIAWILPYEGEFETEKDLIEILSGINKKVGTRICYETGLTPVLLLQKEAEYLQPLPDINIVESYTAKTRRTTVTKDSMITYLGCKYSVPHQYIGKTVCLSVTKDMLYIYYSTDLISMHSISNRRLNYKEEHYKQLLKYSIKNEDSIDELAETNLRQMDEFL